jgi:hypothetical protein
MGRPEGERWVLARMGVSKKHGRAYIRTIVTWQCRRPGMVERAVFEQEWDPNGESIYYRRWDDFPDTEPSTVLLQHPSDPFRGLLRDDLDFEVSVQAFAYDYLRKAQPKVQLPEWWLAALQQPRSDPGNPLYGWMPILWPLKNHQKTFYEPFGSFDSGDFGDDSRAVVLFASDRIVSQFLGSEFGLRIVLRLHKLESGETQASIGGLDASLPFGVYTRWAQAAPGFDIESAVILDALLEQRRQAIATAAGLEGESVKIRSLRLAPLGGGDFQVEWRGVGLPSQSEVDVEPEDQDSGDPTSLQYPYNFTVVGTFKGGEALVHKSAVVSGAAGDGKARVFASDRFSCNPSVAMLDRRVRRGAAILDLARAQETITGVPVGPLSDPPWMEVKPCPKCVRADAGANPNAPRQIALDGTGPEVRSDDASSVQGYFHASLLFERLIAYKLPPSTYFKIAKPRLLVAYRSGISPGPGKGGQTVNACVHPHGWAAGMVGPTPLYRRPRLHLHLACADLARQERSHSWQQGGPVSPKEPLGIGADSRWIWHEFGHVLLMATTGELELRFAHSPGDALAAIVADPSSIIRMHPLWRFATFPWVFLPRRHDRPVETGWSWSGTMHSALASVPPSLHPRRKGYESEQILSSSLFRLYRCIGGDTVIDALRNDNGLWERSRASHYAVYLIASALQILGDARVVPANKPEAFVLALQNADRTAGKWIANFGAQAYDRIGGCAIKAIRWAFERQGMYPDPAAVSGDVPGVPPSVDVFIDSGRPVAASTPYGVIQYGPGSYAPVSLHWQSVQADPIPLWQASANAIRHLGGNQYAVVVGNRGQAPATGVSVQLWCVAWPLNAAAPPDWLNAAWINAGSIGPQAIGPGLTATFGPFTDPTAAGTRHVLLAVADCVGDQANINPLTSLPCATNPTRVIDVVANDNNLGLIVIW